MKRAPAELRSRIMAFYEYLYSTSLSMDDLQLLKGLPINLAAQFAVASNRRLLIRAPILSSVSNTGLCVLQPASSRLFHSSKPSLP